MAAGLRRYENRGAKGSGLWYGGGSVFLGNCHAGGPMRRSLTARSRKRLVGISLLCVTAAGCARGDAAGDQSEPELGSSGRSVEPGVAASSGGSSIAAGSSGSGSAQAQAPASELPDDASASMNSGPPSPMGSAGEAWPDATRQGTSEDASATNATSDSSASKDAQASTTAAGTTIDAGVGESGGPEHAEDGATCTGDLSNIGTHDFDISFTVTSDQTGRAALVNQRQVCTFSVFWDVRMSDGFILAEVDNGANYVSITTTGVQVDDGRPHEVRVRRSSDVLTVYVDGDASGSISAPTSLGKLAPVTTGTDPCIGSPTDTTMALVGSLVNLCVTSP